MDVTPTSVELHIDTLVLEGMSDGDAARIRYAMQRELGRLFTEQGVPEAWVDGEASQRIDEISFDVQRSATPVQLGKHVAEAIYGGS